MYDDSYGLRFDIYERVHLSDEHIGIDQLEEVELTPHIQVLPAGEQVTVRGSLLLAGAYLGTSEDRRSQTLEHWIPVEITLPLNRIRSLDEIRVDIENFDVDLLSTRTLNITGVLSLRGIHVEQSEPPAWETEQFTVVHQASDATTEPTWLRDYGQAVNGDEDESLSEVQSAGTALEQEETDHSSRQEEEQQEQVSESIHEVESDAEGEVPQADSSESSMRTNVEPQLHLHSQLSAINSASEEQSTFRVSQHLFRQPEQAPAPADVEEETAQQHVESEQGELDERQGDELAAEIAQETEAISVATSWNWPGAQWTQPSNSMGSASARLQSEEQEQQELVESLDAESELSRNQEQPEPDQAHAVEAFEAMADEELQDREEQAIEPLEPVVEKSEMKIAIGSSKAEPSEKSESFGFSSLLRSSQQAKEQEREAAEQREAEVIALQASKTYSGEELNWQSLFLNRVDEAHHFSRVRMCIVQRDDTLEQIANRYQMNAREIAMHNQLSEPSITEGQVLYIPTSAVMQK